MPRHRGVFKPDSIEPYELSRSRIEKFIQCPACFYLIQVKGVKFPSIPGFNINEATDVLLKRDFDQYRGTDSTHPYLISKGLSHLVPYSHEHFDLWTQSMHYGAQDRMHTVHGDTNLKIGGGLDDVWLNKTTNKLHIVDYKSTSQKSDKGPIYLDDYYKAAYKRQMDLYIWVMREKGFDIDDIGYFLYCDGDRFTETPFLQSEKAIMEFKLTLIAYQSETAWIEPVLKKVSDLLRSKSCPAHSDNCEHGAFINQVASC
jgi:hypothetical protein